MGAFPLLAQEKVVLQLKWKHQFQFAGYYAALEKGYYAEKGFDVDIRGFETGMSVFESVVNGDATFGVSDSGIILQRMQGKPVVLVTTVYQQSPLVLLTLESSGIRSPYDLIGKKVMYRKGEDSAVLTGMFYKLEIRHEDFQYVPHNFQDDILLSGEVDAFSAYTTNQPFLYREKNVKVNIIDPINYGVDFYGDLLFTSESYARENTQRALDFAEASLRGWQYAMDNKEEIVALIQDKYDSSASADLRLFEAKELDKLIKSKWVPLGTLHPERFENIAQMYRDLNMAAASASYDGLFIEDYTEQKRSETFNRNLIILFVGVLLMFLLTLVSMLLFNRRLKYLVNEKTQYLKLTNTELESSLKTIQLQNEALEQAKRMADQANEAKSLFLANMSHEIRTPMNGIYGSLQLLQRGIFAAEQDKLVASATDSTKKLLQILNDILDFSKIEAGKLSLETVKFNFEALVRSVYEDFEAMAIAKSVDMKLVLPDFTHPERLGDPGRIKQVISNLLSNAIKFTDEGEVQLVVEEQGLSLIVQVKDSGIGISESEVERLFSRFEQCDQSTTRRFGGTGLGLAIARSLLELMGGSIKVESLPGKGSVFTVELKLSVAETESFESKSADQAESVTERLDGLRILVAEDNKVNQLVVKSMLEREGAEVNLVDDGAKAISEFESFRPDVVILDIQMPGVDGIDACREIRKSNQQVPIIALTANVMREDIESYLVAGFNHHLGKPIKYEALISLVKNVS